MCSVKLRISSTKNIQKITKSMKMIASTRLIKAQRGMEVAKRYGQASSCNFFFLSLFFSANPSGHLTLNVIYGGESFVKIFH